MDVKYKKPVFNNFTNMKNSDKKIPANLGKNKGSSNFLWVNYCGIFIAVV